MLLPLIAAVLLAQVPTEPQVQIGPQVPPPDAGAASLPSSSKACASSSRKARMKSASAA